MSIWPSICSFSGGINSLMVLTLIQLFLQPLLASQVDDSRHSGPLVSFLDDWSINIPGFGDTVSKMPNLLLNVKMEIPPISNCARKAISESLSCKQKVTELFKSKENNAENECKAKYEIIDCDREAGCRVCDKEDVGSLMQAIANGDVMKRIQAECSQFRHFEPKLECSSHLLTIVCIVVGVIAMLVIVGVVAFVMLRSSPVAGQRLGGNKSAIQAGPTSKSTKTGSSTGGSSGTNSRAPSQVV